MIQFVQVNNKVRFAVNRGIAEHDGLVLSSELLKVALTTDAKGMQEVKP